mmetsp:Transcript_131827/g.281870  ORF Transcript_131827/g.281870 Transcript_131827/m.281870 type:complete len:248 (-) Transcript_131827:51-794(-)
MFGKALLFLTVPLVCLAEGQTACQTGSSESSECSQTEETSLIQHQDVTSHKAIAKGNPVTMSSATHLTNSRSKIFALDAYVVGGNNGPFPGQYLFVAKSQVPPSSDPWVDSIKKTASGYEVKFGTCGLCTYTFKLSSPSATPFSTLEGGKEQAEEQASACPYTSSTELTKNGIIYGLDLHLLSAPPGANCPQVTGQMVFATVYGRPQVEFVDSITETPHGYDVSFGQCALCSYDMYYEHAQATPFSR